MAPYPQTIVHTTLDFIAPRPCTHADLLRVHTPQYLQSLHSRPVLARILEVPAVNYLPAWLVAWRMLRPIRWATGGTILACRLALERGLAINLGGGYHHVDRWVPIFTEPWPYLEEAWELAKEGAVQVITRRDMNVNWRTRFERIIKRAGLTPWPKLFQNLRASRETELIEQGLPEHGACSWIGNSHIVARTHYLQITEEHFQKAARQTARPWAETAQNSARSEDDPERPRPYRSSSYTRGF